MIYEHFTPEWLRAAVEGHDEHEAAIAGKTDEELTHALTIVLRRNENWLDNLLGEIEAEACDEVANG